MWIFIIILFFGIIFESTITTIPLVLDIILVLYILKRNSWVFATAFVLGLILDLLMVRNLGGSSILFLIFLFVVGLYERKFEIVSNYFVFFSSFLGSLLFLLIFGYDYIFQQGAISAIFSAFLFKGMKLLTFKNDE